MPLGTPIPADPTPCYDPDPDTSAELQRLFASTDLLDHREAASLCGRCYFQASCRRLAQSIAESPEGGWCGAPSGTWGGELYINGKRPEQRYRRQRGAA